MANSNMGLQLPSSFDVWETPAQHHLEMPYSPNTKASLALYEQRGYSHINIVEQYPAGPTMTSTADNERQLFRNLATNSAEHHSPTNRTTGNGITNPPELSEQLHEALGEDHGLRLDNFLALDTSFTPPPSDTRSPSPQQSHWQGALTHNELSDFFHPNTFIHPPAGAIFLHGQIPPHIHGHHGQQYFQPCFPRPDHPYAPPNTHAHSPEKDLDHEPDLANSGGTSTHTIQMVDDIASWFPHPQPYQLLGQTQHVQPYSSSQIWQREPKLHHQRGMPTPRPSPKAASAAYDRDVKPCADVHGGRWENDAIWSGSPRAGVAHDQTSLRYYPEHHYAEPLQDYGHSSHHAALDTSQDPEQLETDQLLNHDDPNVAEFARIVSDTCITPFDPRSFPETLNGNETRYTQHQFLLVGKYWRKQTGREICQKGNLPIKDATVRGWLRMLVKDKTERVRRPRELWTVHDDALLFEGATRVRTLRSGKGDAKDGSWNYHWKELAKWMSEHGASYRFSSELVAEMHRAKRDSRQEQREAEEEKQRDARRHR